MKSLQNDRHHLTGMLYIVASAFVFTLVNALIKGVAARYPINQIVFVRFFFALVPTALILYKAKGFQGFKLQKASFQIFRACLGAAGLSSMFYAFAHMPLADAVAITFSASLFMVILALPILKEKPTIKHVLAVVLGFFGILLIANPTGDVLNFFAFLCALGAFIDSIILTTGRKLTLEKVSPEQVSFYYALIASVFSGITLFFWVKMPENRMDMAALVFLGVGGGVGQHLMTKGFAFAPAAVAAPMIYTASIWSLILGFLFWAEVPSILSLMGTALIICSGLYISYLESKNMSR